MQTILGSGGAIGVELAKALPQYTEQIRLVSRNPKKVNSTDELFSADLTKPSEIDKAIEGSETVYVTVGFPYSVKVWQQTWPPFIQNVIKSCIEHKAKLVFFDNIYMYDLGSIGNMTEEAKVNPPSKKGKVREEVANLILNEMKSGSLEALIARSADFYGPGIANTSMLTETVLKPLAEGKKANWMASANYKHSFTYTPDAGKATALLGNTEDAYGEVWHLPTADNPPTGKEWIEIAAKAMNKESKFLAAPKWIIQVMGLFNPLLREMPEMMYQYDRDYVFNSNKFSKRFGMKATPYIDGIQEIINSDSI